MPKGNEHRQPINYTLSHGWTDTQLTQIKWRTHYIRNERSNCTLCICDSHFRENEPTIETWRERDTKRAARRRSEIESVKESVQFWQFTSERESLLVCLWIRIQYDFASLHLPVERRIHNNISQTRAVKWTTCNCVFETNCSVSRMNRAMAAIKLCTHTHTHGWIDNKAHSNEWLALTLRTHVHTVYYQFSIF